MGKEVPTTREGGGLIDLGGATNPLVFASPTALSFPVNGGIRSVALTDAGTGAGSWSVAIEPQQNAAGIAFDTERQPEHIGRQRDALVDLVKRQHERRIDAHDRDGLEQRHGRSV